MSTATTTPKQQTKRPREEDYLSLTTEQLIAAIRERDMTIALRDATISKLNDKRQKVTAISPEKAQEKADKLRKQVVKDIKKQLKYKAICKKGSAPFLVSMICEEETFRAFLRIPEGEKTKGERINVHKFQDEIVGEGITKTFDRGFLGLKGMVSVKYTKKNSELQVSGGYSCGYGAPAMMDTDNDHEIRDWHKVFFGVSFE